MRNGHNKRAPVRLGREARELYERTIEMYDITDPPSLLLLMNAALALDRLRAAERTVANEGSTFRDRFNQVKAHPAWVRLYREHRDEIEAEWRRRGWSRTQKQVVLTPYFERGLTLKHDAARDERMALWHEWSAVEGWKTETFPQYLERTQKERG